MKKILCIIIVLLSLNQIVIAETDSTKLAYAFLKRLTIEQPITTAEMNIFFHENNFLNNVLLWQLDYIDDSGKILMPLPEYSPLGELFRLNRAKLIKDIDIKNFVAIEGKQQFFIDGNKQTTNLYKYVLISDFGQKDITKLNTIIFTYSIQQNKLDFPIYVNGISLMDLLGFKYQDGLPELSADMIKKLKLHLTLLK